MNELLTWQNLGTMAGAVSAVVVITQFIKWLTDGSVEGIHIRIVSFITAFGCLVGSAYFSSGLDFSIAILSLFNAVIVTLTANGLYDGTLSIKNKFSNDIQ